MIKMDATKVYQITKNTLALGARYGRIYEKTEKEWVKIPEHKLPIKIRSVFTKEESETISSACIKEVIERLIQDPELQVEFTDETEERYVNVKNGVFDVESAELINDGAFCFSYMLDFNYVEKDKRKTTNFDQFLRASFPNEFDQKRILLYQIMGYSLSDYTKAKTAFFLVGESNSGKSTILELIQEIMPKQSVTAIPLYRLENRFNLARLADARLNISTELSEKSFAATDIYKMLTSNEIVTAEHKGKKPFEFRLRCKAINAGNMLPDMDKVEGMEAILNRMTILLFPVSIPKEEQDMQLSQKLWEERDSIFSNALDELSYLVADGFKFTEPDDSRKMKDQIRSKSHCLQDFIDERCVIEKDAEEHFTTLYDAFKDFCTENLLDVKLTKSQFSQKISQMPGNVRGKFRIRGSRPLYGVRGMRLKKDAEYILQDSHLYYSETSGSEKMRNNGTAEQEEV